jgi:hypothetical protein
MLDGQLIGYNIEVLKNVMRDIQKYGIEWLVGSDRDAGGQQLMKYNGYVNSYEKFVGDILTKRDFYEIYEFLYLTSALPLWELLVTLDGLEVLILHISKSMTKICVEDTVKCTHALIRQNYIMEDLYSSSWVLLSCNRTGLLRLLQDTQYKIEILGLRPIVQLNSYIAKVIYKCQAIKDICPHRVLGYNSL